jgi:hypothetical protein
VPFSVSHANAHEDEGWYNVLLVVKNLMRAKHILTYDHMVQQPITYALKNLYLVYTLDQFFEDGVLH